MSFQIQDGTGSNRKVRVDNANRLLIDGTVRTEAAESSKAGDSFLVSTGYINHTVATPVGLLYLKNNGDAELVVDRFNFNLQSSTGGAVDFGRFIFYKNPTTLTGGVTGTNITNLNFGSSIALDVEYLIGNGSTTAMSGGTPFGSPLISEGEVSFIEGNIILPKGTSFGMAYVPPSGNTGQNIAVGINLFKRIVDF